MFLVIVVGDGISPRFSDGGDERVCLKIWELYVGLKSHPFLFLSHFQCNDLPKCKRRWRPTVSPPFLQVSLLLDKATSLRTHIFNEKNKNKKLNGQK